MAQWLRRTLLVVMLGWLGAAPAQALCGDGALDGGEQCDLAAQNGSAGGCCRTDCQYVTFGTPCPDTAANNCRIAACENGFCNQNAISIEPNGSLCGVDANANDCVAPLCVNGACNAAKMLDAGVPCTLAAPNECLLAQCSGTATTCGVPKTFGTPCTDSEPFNCKVAACENGFCNDNAISLEPNGSLCGVDADPSDCVAPLCLNGVCNPTKTLVAGTGCTLAAPNECLLATCSGTATSCGTAKTFGTLCTDSVATDCRRAACEAGFCNQNSVTIEPDGAPCGADADASDCVAPLCKAAVCGTNPVPADSACADSAPGDCLAARCTIAGVCNQSAAPLAEGAPCADTTLTDRFKPACDAAGVCDQQASEIRITPALSPAAGAVAVLGLIVIGLRRFQRRR